MSILYVHLIMNIQQFQYILAVEKYKHFETAAESCFVTQSTLSTMISRFEDEIGIQVFNRKTKLVEGILVQGGDDYVRNIDLFCNESNRVSDSRWVSEETVFRITKVPFIKDIQNKYLKGLKN